MRFLTALPLLLALAALPCQAQEPAATPANAPAGDKTAFNKSFADFKNLCQEIEELRVKFQDATPENRKRLNEQLREKIAAGQPLVDKMADEALKVYKAAPEADQQVTDLLVGVAAFKMVGDGPNHQGADQYETALEIIKALLEGGNESEGLASMGALAAFCGNEYDLSQKYSAMSRDRGEDLSKIDRDLAMLTAQFTSPRMIEKYKKFWEREKQLRDAEAKANDLPRVKFQTSKGDIVIELFENEAPIAAANMVTLVKKGFYDGTIFHRVLPRFMAQGGDPQGTGGGGPGYTIPCECYEDDARMHFRGSLSMAHAGRDTGGSQFFLTFIPTDHLNPDADRNTGHTVFGRVIEGMEVLGELHRIDPGERGQAPDKIVKATVIRDRGHDYSFKKLPGR